MHEAALMAGLMRQIADAAKAEGARRVTRVSLRLGALSQISAAHLAEHFEHASRGSIAQGARLDVTVSDDIAEANAEDILLEGIEVET